MQIDIINVGKLKESYLREGVNEYVKRLNSYAKIKIIEVSEEKAPEALSQAERNEVKKKEGKRILSKINTDTYVFTLIIEGRERTSEDFAKEISQLMIYGKSKVAFIIGGSLGLSEEVLKRSDTKISFGKMTFPHQLMRLILVEQIYRAFRIIREEPYHK